MLAFTFRPVIEGDGVGYYTYLHAVLVSHNLDFTSEYAAAIASHTPVYARSVAQTSATGHLTDYFPVGPALLTSPVYALGLLASHGGEPQYGGLFVGIFTFTSLFYGLAGLAISFALAVHVVRRERSAMVGVLIAVAATPYVFYLLTDPSYSHTFSVFCVSAFLFAWWMGPPATWRGWFVLGLLAGLMALTRFQDGALVAIVLIDWKRLRWPALMLVPGALITFAPQLWVDQAQFGQWLPQRPPGQALNPLGGNYLGILFSSFNGLVTWTPSVVVAAAGVFLIRDRRLKLACALAFLIEFAIIGSAPDSVGASFGQRRFLGLIPFAVIGFAALADRVARWPLWVGAMFLSLWNLTLIANFEYLMPSGDPGYARLTTGQLAAVTDLPRLLVKGSAIRDLLLWNQSHIRFDPIAGLLSVLIEAACMAAAVAIGLRMRVRGTSTGTSA